MLNFYQEVLMDHYRNPRNAGMLDRRDLYAEQRNSSCGDEVVFTAVITDNVLIDIAFTGKGCVISQAAASLLSERVKNMDIDLILALDNDDLIAMLGMQLGPVRLLCGLLSLMALQNGVREYKNPSIHSPA